MKRKDFDEQINSVVLCVLDGWGDRVDNEYNAINLANTPNWDRLVRTEPNNKLDASAESVGLPKGQMGNSEVGHMSLGSGRVVKQSLARIDDAIADSSIVDNKYLKNFIRSLWESRGVCHLLGLLSPGGVHSHDSHILAFAQILSESGICVKVHAFLDGRDAPPSDGKSHVSNFLQKISKFKNCTIASISGRYWAMDRDLNWERTKIVHDAIVSAIGNVEDNPNIAIEKSYRENILDEFFYPAIIGDYGGVEDGDALLSVNFRSDRVRQILSSMVDPSFAGFIRSKVCKFSCCLGMVEYSANLNNWFSSMFPPLMLNGILGQVVSESGMRQLRIAESEKYAHVTFFFNGGREEEFDGEERILVNSPKVATYDLQPEMSAPEVAEKLIQSIYSCDFNLIIVNFANGDMVGHTGILEAAIDAVSAVDNCLGSIETAVRKTGAAMLVTADHGNCEMMYDNEKNEIHTQHTLNEVPVILVNGPLHVKKINSGRLSDVAPTILHLLNLKKPKEMTGNSLINEEN